MRFMLMNHIKKFYSKILKFAHLNAFFAHNLVILVQTRIVLFIYQSQNLTVASARNWTVCRQGRRGQGSRRQGRGRNGRTGQGRGTYQKRTEQKQSRVWAKSRAGHDGHCAI